MEEKTLEDDKLRVEETIARISNSSSLLERCNRDWSEVLKDLKGEEKTKEEKKLHELALIYLRAWICPKAEELEERVGT